jgi:hypothetical protein
MKMMGPMIALKPAIQWAQPTSAELKHVIEA